MKVRWTITPKILTVSVLMFTTLLACTDPVRDAFREEYERFVSVYGVRRTNPGYWAMADWFQDQYLREKPILAGLLDLNRYQNR